MKSDRLTHRLTWSRVCTRRVAPRCGSGYAALDWQTVETLSRKIGNRTSAVKQNNIDIAVLDFIISRKSSSSDWNRLLGAKLLYEPVWPLLSHECNRFFYNLVHNSCILLCTKKKYIFVTFSNIFIVRYLRIVIMQTCSVFCLLQFVYLSASLLSLLYSYGQFVRVLNIFYQKGKGKNFQAPTNVFFIFVRLKCLYRDRTKNH